MEQYTVTGMSCAACQARVEKAVSQVSGVTSCAVSLLTNSMGVEGTASQAEIIKAVENAGYGAFIQGGENKKALQGERLSVEEEALKDRETPLLKRRLILSLGFLLLLMYITMGHNMWGWPLPSFLEHNHIGLGLLQMLLAAIVMLINRKFFVSGFTSLFHGAPNMDTLIALGSGVSFAWSIYVLFKMTYLISNGTSNMDLMELYHNQLYFESAAMILAFITIGKMLEAMSKGRTTDALKSLMKLAPKTAVLIKDGKEAEVGIDEVLSGDIFVVRPGENIPVDGIVLEGSSAVNEAALTGESIPVDKNPGDVVSAATTNTSGFIKCQATRVGEDTTLSQIIKMVFDAAATKAPIAKIADKVSSIFVPTVITLACITTVGWLIAGESFSLALERGISVLVISCPCALGLATPVAIMVGNGKAAKNGILFKTSQSLEQAGKIQIIALDKTGTITSGEPKVTDIIACGNHTEDELLSFAFALEQKSEHPLAKAIIARAEELNISTQEVSDFEALPGNGLKAKLNGSLIQGGSQKYIQSIVRFDQNLSTKAEELSNQGKTPLLFTKDDELLGIIAVADVIKTDSPEAISQLRKMGIEVVMLTGDNEKTARAIGKQAGVTGVIAGVLPDGKEATIRDLQESGAVAMVGDGINDAPALTRADIGIAIGAGSDVAIDSADIVLMNSKLSDVAAAIRLSRRTLKNIYENLFWAFFYNLILIPVAAGLTPLKINPMMGAAAMSLSSFTVCTNALRLNLFDLHNDSHDKPLRKAVKLPERKAETETETKEVNIAIEGMMCEHCEKRIENALEKLEGVESVKADHTSGKAKLTVTSIPSLDRIKKAIEEEDYKFIGMEKEKEKMEKTLKVEGMMCQHCEMTVKKALEALDGVSDVVADHEKGIAVVKLDKDVDEQVLKKAVEDKDYKVTGIE